ncbi:MAG TPA: flagellar basal body L-ring protein FlgH [Patescibacteria group bacterium]|nr:flagellar basal body L-ring protein FlgH [Patescibacteria group bacterium]
MWKRKGLALLTAGGLLLGSMMLNVPAASADSLWSESAPSANLFGDRKARAIGDILTIVISESSAATRTGNTSNTKAASADIKGSAGIIKFNDVLSGSSDDSYTAKGSITNSNTVSGRLTVKVTEIKPNGNLVVSGTQMIKQNKDEQKIIISGVVRPEDISADNTVLSSYVADAEIRIDGKGPISDKQRQGILTQIFNFLW